MSAFNHSQQRSRIIFTALFCIVMVPVILGNVIAQPIYAPNVTDLLLNGNFETPGSAERLAAHWSTVLPSGARRKCGDNIGHSSLCAYRFVGQPTLASRIKQSLAAPMGQQNDTLVLSAYIKAQNLPMNKGDLHLSVIYASGERAAARIKAPTGTYGWTYFTVPLNLTDTATSAKVKIRLKPGGGKFWVDDVSLELLPGGALTASATITQTITTQPTSGPSATPTSTPTFTHTPTHTPTSTQSPFDCDKLSVEWDVIPFIADTFYWVLKNDNAQTTEILRTQLSWQPHAAYPALYLQNMAFEAQPYWVGSAAPIGQEPQTSVDTATDGVFDDAAYRFVPAMSSGLWTGWFRNGPINAANYYILQDFDATFEFSNPNGGTCLVALTPGSTNFPTTTPTSAP